MGLNHQMASLSCALGEAYVTKRTLLLPPTICLFALHTERWSSSSGPGENCVPIETLFDLQALSKLVSVQVLSRNETDADKKPARRSRVLGGAQRVTPSPIAHISGSGWPSARIAREYPCGGGAALVRRSVNTFWFQQCARRLTDYNTLATELNRLVGAPPNAAKPMNIILRSGLFFSQNIKAAAREIYPAGRGQLEPVSVVVCAALKCAGMMAVSLQALGDLYAGDPHHGHDHHGLAHIWRRHRQAVSALALLSVLKFGFCLWCEVQFCGDASP